MHVVILGGGVIGACAAYYLARRGAEVTVVERNAVACAASGKSGGFLARDWCDGTPVMHLARRSFALHAQLAAELGGESWGYRPMTAFGGTVGRPRASVCSGAGPGWVAPDLALTGLGSANTTAQFHPGAFTAAMMRAAQGHGAVLEIAEVSSLLRRGESVLGVRAGAELLDADAVVVAMGPWSALAARWLPLPPVYGLKGHSLVLGTGLAVPAEALFLEYREPTGSMLSPEVFPRPDGTTYVCGINSQPPVPVDPGQVVPDEGAAERLLVLCARVSPVLANAPVLASQACYRPVTGDGLPMIGAIPGAPGAYVATGHGVWGILNAPGTGEALAELVLDGAARTVDLAPFDPARFGSVGPGRIAISLSLPG